MVCCSIPNKLTADKWGQHSWIRQWAKKRSRQNDRRVCSLRLEWRPQEKQDEEGQWNKATIDPGVSSDFQRDAEKREKWVDDCICHLLCCHWLNYWNTELLLSCHLTPDNLIYGGSKRTGHGGFMSVCFHFLPFVIVFHLNIITDVFSFSRRIKAERHFALNLAAVS